MEWIVNFRSDTGACGTMNAGDFAIITEMATAIAGFSGIAVALSNRGNVIPPVDRFRTLNLLTWALSAAFASTLPLVAESLSASGSQLWQWSSAAFCVVLVAGGLIRFHTARRLTSAERAALSPMVWSLTVGGNMVLIVWQLSNVAGWIGPPSPAPILIGLIWLIGVSALIFVRLLTIRQVMTEDWRFETRTWGASLLRCLPTQREGSKAVMIG